MSVDVQLPELLRNIGLQNLTSFLKGQVGIETVECLKFFTCEELKDVGVERLGDRLKLVLAGSGGASAVPVPNPGGLKKFFDNQDTFLREYHREVVEQGVDSTQLLAEATDSDLDVELGISKAGHRKMLTIQIKKHNSQLLEEKNGENNGTVMSNMLAGRGGGGYKGKSSTSEQASPTPSSRPKGSRPMFSTLADTTDELETSNKSKIGQLGISTVKPANSDGGGRHTPISSFDDDYSSGLSSFSKPSPLTKSPLVSSVVDRPKRHHGARRTSTSLENVLRQKELEPITQSCVINVFENGRIYKDGAAFFKNVSIPPGVRDLKRICAVITRALGWNTASYDIGAREVAQLWGFSGKLLTAEDIVPKSWVIAGTANSVFNNNSNSSSAATTTSEKKDDNTGEPVFMRLSQPEAFTGVQKTKHARSTLATRYSSSKYAPDKIKNKDRLQIHKEKIKKQALATVGTPSGKEGKELSGSSYSDCQSALSRSTGSAASSATGTAAKEKKVLSATAPKKPTPKATGTRSGSGGSGRVSPAPTQPTTNTTSGTTTTAATGTGRTSPAPIISSTAINGLPGSYTDFPETARELESANKHRLKGWVKGPLLGRGSFGMVYKGTLTDGTEAAVKMVCLGKGQAPAEIQQLFQEIRFIEQLEHRNIVKYYGCLYDEDNNQVEIFLQLMPGGSLASKTKEYNGKVPEHLCRKFIRQLLNGLEYLHMRKVVHRDVKGANVLIDADGNCAIADFGTSKSIDNMVSKSVGCTTMVGTPYWMAPEVITACDDGAYDTKVDVWSVGCTLVEMVTGQPPWSGQHENMWAAIFHIAQSTEPPPLPPDLGKGIRNFLIRCFIRDPSKRPSCTDLLHDEWLLE